MNRAALGIAVVLAIGVALMSLFMVTPTTPLEVRDLIARLGSEALPDPDDVEERLTETGVQFEVNIPYANVAGVAPERQQLDVYKPQQPPAQPEPIILYIHGGGWVGGDKGQALFKPALFVPAGYLFAAANYRLRPEATLNQMAQSVADAFAWLHDHAQNYGGDPKRIFLMGHSAGAHLVSVISTNPTFLARHKLSTKDIAGVIAMDVSIFNMQEYVPNHAGRLQQIVFAGTESEWPEVSPWLHVDQNKAGPPFLAVYSDRRPDEKKTLILDFVARLSAAGTYTATYETTDKSHATLDYDIGKEKEELNNVLLEFLQEARSRRTSET